jgi:low temperature requirement protein LtrA
VSLRFDWLDIVLSLVGPLLAALLGWGFIRNMNAGAPLGRLDKYLLIFGYFFLAGGALLLLVGGGELGWPQPLWIFLIVVWGALLFYIARTRYQRASDTQPAVSASLGTKTAASLPVSVVIVRALLGLFAIGALTRPNLPIIVVVGILAVVSFLVEKRWQRTRRSSPHV